MAGIRGIRQSKPKAGGKPTGMFSSKGKQKQDGATGPNMDVKNYAHSGGGETKNKPKGGDRAKRHQKHYGKSY